MDTHVSDALSHMVHVRPSPGCDTLLIDDERQLASGSWAADSRLTAALQYRIERKKLVKACITLLDIYVRPRTA